MSKADVQLQSLLKNILENGISTEGKQVRPHWEDGTPAHTIKVFGAVLRYDLQDEFPIHTLRPTPMKTCIDEMLWIWQRKSNNIKDLNAHIWDAWADENGSIGKAYGYQMGVKHTYPEGEFDQVDRVIYDLKNNQTSRRIITNLFNHQDLHEMALYPCVYNCTFNVDGNKLNMMLNQRSADLIAAAGFNLTQYAVLVYLMAHISGLEPGELVHVIADAHIYDRHIEMAKELVSRDPLPAPIFHMNKEKKDFYEFTTDDFWLENYQTHPQIKNIPVAI